MAVRIVGGVEVEEGDAEAAQRFTREAGVVGKVFMGEVPTLLSLTTHARETGEIHLLGLRPREEVLLGRCTIPQRLALI